MISTSSYNACRTDKFKTCSISFDKGKDAEYTVLSGKTKTEGSIDTNTGNNEQESATQ